MHLLRVCETGPETETDSLIWRRKFNSKIKTRRYTIHVHDACNLSGAVLPAAATVCRAMKTVPIREMTEAERMAIEEGREPHPRISADAQFVASKIVMHMWIIFVLLPIVLTILYRLLK